METFDVLAAALCIAPPVIVCALIAYCAHSPPHRWKVNEPVLIVMYCPGPISRNRGRGYWDRVELWNRPTPTTDFMARSIPVVCVRLPGESPREGT
uniref:Putative secreted peptide n=1 Tax=Anopheles braziliensis TaxID=58242 RepID=A0A2M3ZTJ2_9DIPT